MGAPSAARRSAARCSRRRDGCEGRALHSLHAYFLRRVPPDVTIELRVERLSDGRRLAHRRVQIRLEDRVLCEVSASFTTAQDGVAFQEVAMDPGVPAPEALLPDVELAKIEGWPGPPPPVEWRWIEYPSRVMAPGEAPLCRGWARPRTPLPDDPRLHAAALAYLSDWASQGAVERRYARGFAHERFVSLDHAVWLHQPARWDDWLLVTTRSDIAADGRALTRREVYTQSGSAGRHDRAGSPDRRAGRGGPDGALAASAGSARVSSLRDLDAFGLRIVVALVQERQQPLGGNRTQHAAVALGRAFLVLHAHDAAHREIGDRIEGRLAQLELALDAVHLRVLVLPLEAHEQRLADRGPCPSRRRAAPSRSRRAP